MYVIYTTWAAGLHQLIQMRVEDEFFFISDTTGHSYSETRFYRKKFLKFPFCSRNSGQQRFTWNPGQVVQTNIRSADEKYWPCSVSINMRNSWSDRSGCANGNRPKFAWNGTIISQKNFLFIPRQFFLNSSAQNIIIQRLRALNCELQQCDQWHITCHSRNTNWWVFYNSKSPIDLLYFGVMMLSK